MDVQQAGVPITVIIPVLNEELNIVSCLESVSGWASQIVVIDAQSTDKTVKIAKQYTNDVFIHTFGKHKYTQQKNWALTDLPLQHNWVLFVDADERVTPALKNSIEKLAWVDIPESVAGFTIDVRLRFLGTEIKHSAYSPNWALRLFHKDRARFVSIDGLEFLKPNGDTSHISGLILHEDKKTLAEWITKQNERSTLEALSMLDKKGQQQNANDKNVERRGHLRVGIWRKLPLLIRPFIIFFYSYIFRLGFLDGKSGFIYSFFLGLWYRVLVDAKYIEYQLQRKDQQNNHE